MSTIPLPGALSMQDRRVLVTGAASGIGRATAVVLAQLGATVVITDRAALDEARAAPIAATPPAAARPACRIRRRVV